MFIVHSFLGTVGGLLLRIFAGSGDTRFRFNESPNHHQNSPRDSDLGIQASAVTGESWILLVGSVFSFDENPGGNNIMQCIYIYTYIYMYNSR